MTICTILFFVMSSHLMYYFNMSLKIFISNKSDGSMRFNHDINFLEENKKRIEFFQKNNINPDDTTLVSLNYDGDNYRRYSTISDSNKGDGITRESTIEADALVVVKPNHALFLPLADCIGAVIYDPVLGILMVSHLGRHHLEQDGGTESINYLIKHHNCNPKDLNIFLSPAAGKEAYPVFKFNNRGLHEIAVEQLVKAGVPIKNIEVSPVDTAKDKDYYSHSQFLKGNREDDGRFAIAAYFS